MILVDTSVWISHLRTGDAHMRELLDAGVVTCHPFVIAELACGHLADREQLLSLLHKLPSSLTVQQDEFLNFIEAHRLWGWGIGFVDVHLLASARLMDLPLWTFDCNLQSAAEKLRVNYP